MLRCGLIGRSLSHSFSPGIHRMIGGYEYGLYEVEREDLEVFLNKTELDGLNVTIPYKKDVIPLCRELSPRAAEAGSVNTMIRLPGGGWLGENTDYDGFLYMLGPDAEAMRGKKALVLGSGGASAAVCAVLRDAGVPYTVISRSGENNYGSLQKHAGAQIIINATPVGMYPNNGETPVDLKNFPRCELVLDVIYNPARTALLLCAEDMGVRTRNGLSMLVAQAVRAGELFLGKKLDGGLVGSICAGIGAATRNVSLIGMPGCGKSTVAHQLSRLTGRPVEDTDTIVEAMAGMSIPDIFAKYGERHFRALETQALSGVSKKSGIIIATGGGIVETPENRRLIRQNGVCVFLERDLSELDTEGRPLSLTEGVSGLYARREHLYRSWSDRTFRNDDPLKTVQNIKEAFGL